MPILPKAIKLKKSICLLFAVICFPAFCLAQSIQDDFEGNGNISSWFGDDCGLNTAFSNPFSTGINTSPTVLEYNDTGGQYGNVRFDIASYFNLSSQATFSLKVYVPSSSLTGNQPNQISLKLQDGNLPAPWSTQSEIIKPLQLDQWQVVTFDFVNDPYINLDPNSPAPVTRTDLNRLVLQVNGENNNDLVVAYFDDFVFNGTTGGGGGNPIFNQLVWADEFSVDGPVDTSKWFHQTQLPNGNSWYNGEVQHYTDRTDNSYVDDGHLYIVAKKEQFTDQGHTKEYTSARLNSKFAFTYGRVEVRAKLPFGVGTWPAIWTLGKNIAEPGGFWNSTHGTVPWPACGEIDIMEHWGHNQNVVQSALHTPSSFGGTINKGSITATDVSNTFHIYAVEWTPTEMKFSLDSTVFYTYAPNPQNPSTWPFNAEQYLLLNVAMQPAIDPGFTQSAMVLDYVRVYQQGPTSLSDQELDHDWRIFPNPVTNELSIHLEGLNAEAQVQVYSPQGALLYSSFLKEPAISLDWSTYPSGIYMVVIESEAGRIVRKIVKR